MLLSVHCANSLGAAHSVLNSLLQYHRRCLVTKYYVRPPPTLLAMAVLPARQMIREACDKCPASEDVWLESSRLHPPDLAKTLLARGVAALPRSEKLWLAAARLETEKKARSRVLRKALENLPTSPTLWKAAVDLEDEGNAKILLGRAVECCPKVGFWPPFGLWYVSIRHWNLAQP